jgi:hypothetical protein
MEAVAEQVFYEADDILISNTRLSRGDMTFAMSQVTSVGITTQKPFSGFAVVIIGAIGLFTLMGGIANATTHQTGASIFLFCVSAFMAFIMLTGKPKYLLQLHTAGGEKTFFSSKELTTAKQLQGLITQAIISRG